MAKLCFDPEDYLYEISTNTLIGELKSRKLNNEELRNLFDLQNEFTDKLSTLIDAQTTLADQMKFERLIEIAQKYTLSEIESLM